MAKKLAGITDSQKADLLQEVAKIVPPVLPKQETRWARVQSDWMKFNLDDSKFYRIDDEKPLKYGFTYETSIYKNLMDPTSEISIFPPWGFATKETCDRIVKQLIRLAPNSLFEVRQQAKWSGPFYQSVPSRDIFVNDHYFGNAGLIAIQLQSVGWYWWCQSQGGSLKQHGAWVPQTELPEPEDV
jgi:hypothetical protein